MNQIEQLRNDMLFCGRKLMQFRLVHSQVGNLSVRMNSSMLISGHGCPLDELTDNTVVQLSLEGSWPPSANASSDAVIHRAIYGITDAKAIIHAHSPYAVAESILTPLPCIIAEDVETKCLLKEIPLIRASEDPARTANSCAAALRSHVAIIVRAHGTIAIGSDLQEAYLYVASVEHACTVRNLCRKG